MSKPVKDEAPSTQEMVVAKVSDAYAAAVDKASSTTRDMVAAVEANPLVALLGGLALGAAAGALVPRGAGEKALLAPLGDKLAAAAAAAIAAGREAGAKAVDESGFTTEALREEVTKLFGQGAKAAGSIGTAAFSAARETVRS